jgi:hypothetical protein
MPGQIAPAHVAVDANQLSTGAGRGGSAAGSDARNLYRICTGFATRPLRKYRKIWQSAERLGNGSHDVLG